MRETVRDLGERQLVLEALTKDIMSNREEITRRLGEIRDSKKRLAEAAKSGMIDGLNVVKT